MEQTNNEYQNVPTRKSHKGLIVAVVVVVLLIISAAVAYVVVSNQPAAAPVTSATPVPEIPSRDEVGQIMESVDAKIDQAAADQAVADAALQQASTPVKVDL